MGELSQSVRNGLLVGGLALVAAAGIWVVAGSQINPCFGPNCRTIRANEVDWFPKVQTPPSTIMGTFTVKAANVNAIESDGTGGACLVADLNALGWPKPDKIPGYCHKNSDCSDPLAGPYDRLPKGWSGYCAADKGVCWVRPGPQTKALCNIAGPPWFPLKPPLPEDVDLDVPYDHLPVSNLASIAGGKPIWLRVLACLNGPGHGCKELDSDDRLEVMGKPKLIPIPKYVAPPFSTVGTGEKVGTATAGGHPETGASGKNP